MDITKLTQIDEFCWTPAYLNLPIWLFANHELLEKMDEMVLEQITHAAMLPGLVGHAMTMPDAHSGYGFPIGGVAAFDAKQGGVISAGGVGFDISCGIRCLRTDLWRENILSHVEELAEKLYQTIPAGVGRQGKLVVTLKELNTLLFEGAKWAVMNGYGVLEDLAFIEENGTMSEANPENVSDQAKERQLAEMGTLGSGNHYLEVQVVNQIFDEDIAKIYGLALDQIIIAIHCGSRGLGHQIASDYLISLTKAAKINGISIPSKDLACAPILSEAGQAYFGAMNAGINCALANRQILTELTRRVFSAIFPQASIATLYDVSHNTCKRERHFFNGKFQEIYVHRKGATRAFGPHHPSLPKKYRAAGQPVCIGGSMGTSSYILAGVSADENPAFGSACHGAGRQMSRKQALKKWTGKELISGLLNKGIYIKSGTLRGVAEEAPLAYKDVNEVVRITEKAGLAKRVVQLRPLISIKG